MVVVATLASIAMVTVVVSAALTGIAMVVVTAVAVVVAVAVTTIVVTAVAMVVVVATRTCVVVVVSVAVMMATMIAVMIAIAEVVMTMGFVMRTAVDRSGDSVMWVAVTIHVEAAMMMVVAVQAVVGMIAVGQTIIVIVMVVIYIIDAECPATCCGVDWTEEIVQTHEDAVLCSVEDVTQIFVAVVEIVVVRVDGIRVAIHHIVHQVICLVDEVVVDLKAVFVLSRGELQLVSHAVGEETCCLTNACIAHCHYAHQGEQRQGQS